MDPLESLPEGPGAGSGTLVRLSDPEAQRKIGRELQTADRPLMPLALQSHDAYVGDRLMNQFGVNGLADYRMAAAVSIRGSCANEKPK